MLHHSYIDSASGELQLQNFPALLQLLALQGQELPFNLMQVGMAARFLIIYGSILLLGGTGKLSYQL